MLDKILEAVGENRIDVIEEVRTLTGFALKEANDFVDQAPVMVAQGLSPSQAREVAAQLREVGADGQLEEHR